MAKQQKTNLRTSTSLHHQHAERGKAGQVLGGAAKNLLKDAAVPHESDNQQVKTVLLTESDDGLYLVSRSHMGLQRNAPFPCHRPRFCGQLLKVFVPFALDFFNLLRS